MTSKVSRGNGFSQDQLSRFASSRTCNESDYGRYNRFQDAKASTCNRNFELNVCLEASSGKMLPCRSDLICKALRCLYGFGTENHVWDH